MAEPIKWITIRGNRIPIYEKAGIGPGEHTVYRAGDLSGGPTGMVFFAAGDEESARLHAEGYSGRSGRKHIYYEYKLNIKKPLVISSSDDSYAQLKAYNKLHGTDYTQVRKWFADKPALVDELKKNGLKKTDLDSIAIAIDKANCDALKSQKKYDSIIYVTGTNTHMVDGEERRKGSFEVSQILVPAENVKDLKPVAEHKRKNRKGN